MRKYLIILPMILFLGCGFNFPSVCDNLEEKSDLCAYAEKAGVRLEDFENGIIILNSLAIGQELYSAEQAKEIITDLKVAVISPLSWLVLKTDIEQKLEKYPGLFIVTESYLSVMTGVDPIPDYDKNRLIGLFDRMLNLL